MNQLLTYAILLTCFLLTTFAKTSAQCGDSLGWMVTVNTFPYHQDFENGPGGWYAAATDALFPATAPPGFANMPRPNTWAYGKATKSLAFPGGANGTDSCWVTGGLGMGNHGPGEVSHLLSPQFDFTAMTDPSISAYISYDVEVNHDAAYLEVSTDNGKTWTIVGDSTTSNFGWYNSNSLSSITTCPSNHGTGWTGTGSGWTYVQHDLYAYAGMANVQLRFTLHSDFSVHRVGLAVDEIRIQNLPPLTVSPDTSHCGPMVLDAGAGWASYLWNTGATTQQIVVSNTGSYIVVTTDAGGNMATDTVNVVIHPLPSFNLGPDQVVCDSTIVIIPGPTFPNSTFIVAVYDSSLMQFVTHWTMPPFTNVQIDSTSHLEVTMIDANGCIAKDSVIVEILASPTVTGTVQHITCPGGNDGRIDLTVNGVLHNPNFFYTTSIATTLPYIDNAIAGVYFFNVIDQVGCQVTDTFIVTEPLPIQGSITASPAPNCSSATGPVTLTVGGGTPPFTISWWHGPTGFTLPGGLLPGNYGLTVTDGNQCEEDIMIPIIFAGSPVATVATTPDFGSNDGTAIATVSGGMSPYTYDWGFLGGGQTNDSITGLAAGADLMTVTDAANCVFATPYIIDYETGVYPGDCNHDQVVDMNDLIPIGLKFGDTGPIRPNATLNWTPQIAPLWGDTLPNGKDIRHVDADGNGTINNDDTLAITLNYGMTHNNLRPAASGGPKLHFMMPTTNLSPGDTITVPIFLGTIDTPVVNLYGIAFSVNYDSSKVEAQTAQTAFPTSWLGTPGSNMLSLDHDLYPMERIDMGLVRTDKMAVNGYGHIADLIVVIDDHIAKRDVPFYLSFSRVFAVDATGEPIEVGHTPGEAVIKVTTGIDEALEKALKMGIDPASGEIRLTHPGHLLTGVSLYDLQGRRLYNLAAVQRDETVLRVGEMASGTYFLEIHTEKGKVTKKLRWMKK